MKFPRNARIFRGQLDMAPFAGVFFLLIMFLLLASLVSTPGIQIDLPTVSAADLSGASGPTIEVQVGRNGQIYIQNQLVNLDELRRRLREAAQSAQAAQSGSKAAQALTLVLYLDKDSKVEVETAIETLASSPDVGIGRIIKAVSERIFEKTGKSRPPP